MTGAATVLGPYVVGMAQASPSPQLPAWSGHIRRPGDQSTQLGEGFIRFRSGGLHVEGGEAFSGHTGNIKGVIVIPAILNLATNFINSNLWKIMIFLLQCLLPWSWYMTTYGKRWFSATCLMQAPSWVPTHHLNAMVNWHDSCWRPCKIHPAKYLLQTLKRQAPTVIKRLPISQWKIDVGIVPLSIHLGRIFLICCPAIEVLGALVATI